MSFFDRISKEGDQIHIPINNVAIPTTGVWDTDILAARGLKPMGDGDQCCQTEDSSFKLEQARLALDILSRTANLSRELKNEAERVLFEVLRR